MAGEKTHESSKRHSSYSITHASDQSDYDRHQEGKMGQ